MYIHYQTTDNKHEQWHLAQLKDLDAVLASAKHLSVLAMDKAPREDLNYDEVRYKGDLAFDIDHSDITQSITDLQKLLDALSALNVEPLYCRLYASGSKGFHIIVPAKLFSDGRAIRHLPNVYGTMALGIMERYEVSGLDMALYHGRRGSLLRVENKERADGKYKVPITLQEARTMTPELYASLTAAPRIGVAVAEAPHGFAATGMTALFERAKEANKKQLKTRNKAKPIPAEMLKAFGDQATPNCIEAIIDYRDIKEGVNFNKAALNVVGYLASTEMSEVMREEIIERFANNSTSTTYTTPEKRRHHITEQLKYTLRGNGHIVFACRFSASVLNKRPCDGCPVLQAQEACAQGTAGIEARADGYYRVGARGADTQLTTFTLFPLSIYCPEGSGSEFVDAVEFEMKVKGETVTRITLTSEAWGSGQAFKKQISPLRRAAFFGNDHDVQKIKRLLLETNHMDKTTTVCSAGIHRTTDPETGEGRLVYVEPGWSITASGLTGTHCLSESKPRIFSLRTTASASPKDAEFGKAFTCLLKSNRPNVVGALLGWSAACHLKPHIQDSQRGYPLLSLYGQAGSGKTESACVYSALSGADYRTERPMSVPSATAYPVKEEVSSTTTIPRILDEVNPGKMPEYRYHPVLDALKAAFTGNALPVGTVRASRGMARSSATQIPYAATSPIMFLSTQATAEAELYDRSLEVRLSRQMRNNTDYESNFRWVQQRGWEHLFKLAKLLMLRALQTDFKTVADWCDEFRKQIPENVEGRAAIGMVTALVGLRFVHHSLAHAGFDEAFLADVAQLQVEVTSQWKGDGRRLSQRKARTEVDNVLRTLASMAMDTDDGIRMGLMPGTHYLVGEGVEGVLYLKLDICFTAYMKFCRKIGQSYEMQRSDQFRELLADEPYFLGEGPLPRSADGCKWAALHIGKLVERGIDIAAFRQQGYAVNWPGPGDAGAVHPSR